jgi:hypothetical protein
MGPHTGLTEQEIAPQRTNERPFVSRQAMAYFLTYHD